MIAWFDTALREAARKDRGQRLALVSAARAQEARVSAPFREVTFCASYKCHCFGVKGGRLSWFRG